MTAASDTPARLVSAAERLLVEGGEEATTLRAVARAARANAAAVHYHFGGRDALLTAVLERYVAPLHARRLELVDQAVARVGDAVPVADLIEAVLRPDLEFLDQVRRRRVEIARFLGRAHTSTGPSTTALLSVQFEQIAARVVPLLRRAVSEVDAGELRERLRLALSLTAGLLATASTGEPTPLGSGDVDLQVRRLVAFCAAGMAAPPVPLPDRAADRGAERGTDRAAARGADRATDRAAGRGGAKKRKKK